MGRGVETFSNSSAIALASKIPTHIGSARRSSGSFKITIGMLVMGSSAMPRTVILMSIVLSLWQGLREDRSQFPIGHRHGFRNHLRLRDQGHKIGIAIPARYHMDMQVM